MNSSGRAAVAAFVITFLGAIPAGAQVIAQPTPPPIVTADAESWYLNAEPITYAGNFYYPAGAQVPFNPNEMVRSGFFMGVPLYTRTTDEPYSVVYVPVGRGFVQPYMRPRTGDVAGTSGTVAPAGTAAAVSPDTVTVPVHQAAGPPTLVAGAPADERGLPRGTIGAVPRTENAPRPAASAPAAAPDRSVGTSGVSTAMIPPGRTRIGPRPEGINAVFIEFEGRRWYANGQPVAIDATQMTQRGTYRGFPVFAADEKSDAQIYVATTTAGVMATPYSRRRPR